MQAALSQDRSFRSELRSAAAGTYDWRGIPSTTLQSYVKAEEREIAAVLNLNVESGESFALYFKNVNFERGNKTGELVSAFLTGQYRLRDMVVAGLPRKEGARRDATIPVLRQDLAGLLREFRREFKGVPDDFDRVVTELDSQTLPRVPLRGILFFAETERADTQIEVGGISESVPDGVLFWTLEKLGILAINVTLKPEEEIGPRVVTLGAALAGAIYPLEDVGDESARSEVRERLEKALLTPTEPLPPFELPLIPEVKRGEAEKSVAAFGIRPEEALILDAEYVGTAQGLAFVLAVLDSTRFVILGRDASDPFASALNEKLGASGRAPLTFTRDPDDAVALLREKIRQEKARLGKDPSAQPEIRAVLSTSNVHADTLRRKLGDDLVRVMGLESFFEVAAGIVSRLGLDSFVRDLQTQVFNQLSLARSA
jgi:hypothetical protein